MVDPAFISNVMDRYNIPIDTIKEIVSGGAKGMDGCGEYWAKEHLVPVIRFMADWDTHNKAAGPIRNKQMADYADKALVIMHKGGSPGSQNMIKQMQKLGKEVFVYEVILQKKEVRNVPTRRLFSRHS